MAISIFWSDEVDGMEHYYLRVGNGITSFYEMYLQILLDQGMAKRMNLALGAQLHIKHCMLAEICSRLLIVLQWRF